MVVILVARSTVGVVVGSPKYIYLKIFLFFVGQFSAEPFFLILLGYIAQRVVV